MAQMYVKDSNGVKPFFFLLSFLPKKKMDKNVLIAKNTDLK